MSKIDEQVNAVVTEVVASQMTGKKFYESKTFWVNVVMALAVAVSALAMLSMGPEMQALVIAGVNLVLRKITKDPIVW